MRQIVSGWALFWIAIACAQRPVEQWRVLYNAEETLATPVLYYHFYDAAGNSYHVGEYNPRWVPYAPVVLSLDSHGALRWKRRWDMGGYITRSWMHPNGNITVFLSNGILNYTPQGELTRAVRLQTPSPNGLRELVAATVDTEGRYYLLLGSQYFASQGIEVVCTDAEGEVQWTYSVPNRYAFDIYVDSEGGVVVLTGIPEASYHNTHYPEFTRLSASGTLLWRSQGNIFSFRMRRFLGENAEGQIVVADGFSWWLVSRTTGVPTFVRGWTPPRLSLGDATSHVMLPNGGFATALFYNTFAGSDFYAGVAVYEPNGTLRWSAAPLGRLRSFGSFDLPVAKIAAAPNSESLWLLTLDRSAQTSQYKTIRFDANGGIEWVRTHEVDAGAQFNTDGILVFPNGESLSLWHENDVLRAVGYDGSGNLRFDQRYIFAEPTYDSASVIPDGAGGVYAHIRVANLGTGSFFTRLQRYDARGNRLWEIDEDADAIQSSPAGDLFTVHLRNNEAVVSRFTPSGSLVWQQRYPMYQVNRIMPLLVGGDNSIFVLGFEIDTNNIKRPRILKIGLDGTLRWAQTYSEPTSYLNLPSVPLPDRGLCVAILVRSPSEWRVLRYEVDGRLAWSETLTSLSNIFIGADAQGHLTVAGTVYVGTESRIVLRRYTPTGTQIWQTTLPGSALDLRVADTGECYLIARIAETMTLYALSPSGVLRWQHTLGEPANFSWRLVLDATGNLYLYGLRWRVPNRFENEAVVRCYRPDGAQEWKIAFSGPMGYVRGIDTLPMIQPDGRRVVLCGAILTDSGGRDAYIMQYAVPQRGDANGDGCVDDADLLIVLHQFGGVSEDADLNGDGIVDDADLLTVLFNFGTGC